MNKEEKKQEQKKEIKAENKINVSCADKQCPLHGQLKARGRNFKGFVVRKFSRRVCIEFERIIHIEKYERYMKKRTRIHARLPDCLKEEIDIGDYVEIKECRPLSKIIHFVVMKKLRSNLQFLPAQKLRTQKTKDGEEQK